MNPAGKVATLKFYVFSHVQLPAMVVKASKFPNDSINDAGPSFAIHCARADVDFGIRIGVGGRSVGPLSSVIVSVQVEHNDTSVFD